MIKVAATVFVLLSSMTCSDQSQIKNAGELRELKTKSGKTVVINETHPNGLSISKVQIIVKGLKQNQIIEAGEMDPVQKVELADLDNDGFEELYIFTQSAGSGSAGKVNVYPFDKNIKSDKIEMPEAEKETLQGYIGHDTFSIKQDTLIRAFPVYREGDSNSKPTGGTQRIFYKLNNGKIEIVKTELKN